MGGELGTGSSQLEVFDEFEEYTRSVQERHPWRSKDAIRQEYELGYGPGEQPAEVINREWAEFYLWLGSDLKAEDWIEINHHPEILEKRRELSSQEFINWYINWKPYIREQLRLQLEGLFMEQDKEIQWEHSGQGQGEEETDPSRRLVRTDIEREKTHLPSSQETSVRLGRVLPEEETDAELTKEEQEARAVNLEYVRELLEEDRTPEDDERLKQNQPDVWQKRKELPPEQFTEWYLDSRAKIRETGRNTRKDRAKASRAAGRIQNLEWHVKRGRLQDQEMAEKVEEWQAVVDVWTERVAKLEKEVLEKGKSGSVTQLDEARGILENAQKNLILDKKFQTAMMDSHREDEEEVSESLGVIKQAEQRQKAEWQNVQRQLGVPIKIWGHPDWTVFVEKTPEQTPETPDTSGRVHIPQPKQQVVSPPDIDLEPSQPQKPVRGKTVAPDFRLPEGSPKEYLRRPQGEVWDQEHAAKTPPHHQEIPKRKLTKEEAEAIERARKVKVIKNRRHL
jgi:hypothetical protein